MVQSGHLARDLPVWDAVTTDYVRQPAKPVIDGEGNYEDHPINWQAEQGYFRDYDVRKQAYRAVFAGAFGATYGNHAVWQMYAPGRQPWIAPERPWTEALNRPGAAQIGYLGRLLASRPMLGRQPAQNVVLDDADEPALRARATGDQAGQYAMVYTPTTRALRVDLTSVAGPVARAWWFNPRTGLATLAGTYPTSGHQTFDPPQDGPDWVLVLDDASREFGAPGAANRE